ncbi:hypothetical protein FDG2_3258 [Candidatus Protofrankia californiensis]|uniref:Uncharacterized protein n=1 Tax=Candidatus Protofrankia californiensis TaxID=1839754 RepID=A0A1C3NZB8_9ACTN|nr:hypothetical protein FDG2_3258 [Candidatus Protofrankia californiensis]
MACRLLSEVKARSKKGSEVICRIVSGPGMDSLHRITSAVPSSLKHPGYLDADHLARKGVINPRLNSRAVEYFRPARADP